MTANEIAKMFFPDNKEKQNELELEILRLTNTSMQGVKWLQQCQHQWVDYPYSNPYGFGTNPYTTSPQRQCLKCGAIENKWTVTY